MEMKADGYPFSGSTPMHPKKRRAHVHARKLVAMAALLERLPEAVALVHEDLSFRSGRRVDPSKGRDGMAAEQVLRVAVLKQHTGLSYERLAFALADSSTYRGFCRLGYEQKPPTWSALQKEHQARLRDHMGENQSDGCSAGSGSRRGKGHESAHRLASWWSPTSITPPTRRCFGTACACWLGS
jgi:hypothetical protein